MKYNEPLRPKGVGKKQLAFPVGTTYTEMSSDESEFILRQSADSPDRVSLEKTTDSIGVARMAGIASASEAHHSAQNFPFEMAGITEFAMSGPSGGISASIPFANPIVRNDNFWYDQRTRYIMFNQTGWYFVRVFYYSTAISGNIDWGLRVKTNVNNTLFGETYDNYIDYRTSSKWCTVSGSTIVNIPNQNELVNTNGRYGLTVELYTTATFASFTSGNTNASLQIFRLADLFEAQRAIFNKNL
jgi:hypothetical protein